MDALVSRIMKKMIDYSEGNLHDINHFLKVHGYARTIAVLEGVTQEELVTVETAAIIHDIACPLCRKKYGNTDGKHQEEEGVILADEFLSDTGLPEAIKERVVYLVGHHHTLKDIDGIDYQILIEADYLVNADEMNLSKSNIDNMKKNVFKTKTGIALLESIYS